MCQHAIYQDSRRGNKAEAPLGSGSAHGSLRVFLPIKSLTLHLPCPTPAAVCLLTRMRAGQQREWLFQCVCCAWVRATSERCHVTPLTWVVHARTALTIHHTPRCKTSGSASSTAAWRNEGKEARIRAYSPWFGNITTLFLEIPKIFLETSIS